jgi:hypothetical protein
MFVVDEKPLSTAGTPAQTVHAKPAALGDQQAGCCDAGGRGLLKGGAVKVERQRLAVSGWEGTAVGLRDGWAWG